MTKMLNDWRQKGGEVSSIGAGSAGLGVTSLGDVEMQQKKPDFNRKPDDAVLQEKADIESGSSKGSLVIKGIEQKFVMQNGKINHAVKGVFLSLPKGEVFGLLGMNGAGKTTLLQTIQGKYVPSGGDATIDGISCVTEIDRARQLFGICPQHDVLWDECTSREHLIAFANIRLL